MTEEQLTPALREEIQDNIMFRYLARKRRERWEATKGQKTPVKVKRYTMGGDLIDDNARVAQRTEQGTPKARVAGSNPAPRSNSRNASDPAA